MRRSLKDIETLAVWAKDNGITLNGLTLEVSSKGHGTGLVATASHSDPGSLLIQVPSHLILSRLRTWDLASEDNDLAQILAANGEFAKTTRGAILIFLLMQITHTSPDILESGYERLPIGKYGPFADYVQYIQTETSLPTFWSEEDAAYLLGTSLEHHHAAKMRSLAAEFAQFKHSCKNLHWANLWLGEDGCLAFQDWLTVDAMWRSRAMDLSDDTDDDSRECLVPVMDMANHTADGIAAYKLAKRSDGDRCAELRLDMDLAPLQRIEGGRLVYQEKKGIKKGEEITISYGNIKGAAEMIFSYGFLDNNLSDARSMMLGWTFPEDDPLRYGKVVALSLEPGIQIYTSRLDADEMCFAGAAVWAMSINEEDGIRIVVNNKVSPQGQSTPCFQLFFKNTLITSKSHLLDVLVHDRAAIVFRARAYAYVLMRIEEELGRLASRSSDDGTDKTNQSPLGLMCAQLRILEVNLLEKAVNYFSAKVSEMMAHPDVTNYSILLEQGLALPALSETEQWARFEDEHDERNRAGYGPKLEEKLETLNLGKRSDIW